MVISWKPTTLLFLLALLLPSFSKAFSFTVTSSISGTANDSISLRWAISSSNARPGPDTIVFNLSGMAPHLVGLSAPLPVITDATFIDGTSQPANGYTGTLPKVILNGFGLEFSGSVQKVSGLMVSDAPLFGIRGTNTDSLTISRCRIIRSGLGIDIIGRSCIRIADCEVYQNSSHGIQVIGDSQRVYIHHNQIGLGALDNDHGVLGSGNHNFYSIRNNVIAHNLRDGIHLLANGSQGNFSQVIIENNSLNHNGGDGLYNGGDFVRFRIAHNGIGSDTSGNYRLGNGRNGILFEGFNDSCMITNNIITKNDLSGCKISGNDQTGNNFFYLSFLENQVVENEEYGLWAWNLGWRGSADTVTISMLQNRINDNLKHGVYLGQTGNQSINDSISITALNNRIYGNGFYSSIGQEGLLILQSGSTNTKFGMTVQDNIAYGNAGTGLMFRGAPGTSSTGYITISNNTTYNNQEGGLFFEGAGSDNTLILSVHDNEVYGNTGSGMFIFGDRYGSGNLQNLRVEHNKVENNGDGFYGGAGGSGSNNHYFYTFKHNELIENQGTGGEYSFSEYSADDTVHLDIAHNQFIRNRNLSASIGKGVVIRGSFGGNRNTHYITIRENRIVESGSEGIYFCGVGYQGTDNHFQIRIQKDTIISNGWHGVNLEEMSAFGTSNFMDLLVEENELSQNGRSGLQLFGPYRSSGDSLIMKIEGNRIINNLWRGIHLVSGRSASNIFHSFEIENNNITNNSFTGILGEGKYMQVKILGNRIETNSSNSGTWLNNAIQFGGSGGTGENHLIIRDNLISSNDKNGISAVDRTDTVLIHNNSILCNGEKGINRSVDPNIPLSPVITSAAPNFVSGTSGVRDTIEIYRNHACSCQNKGQGDSLVATVIADSSGNWSYSGSVPSVLTATATQTNPPNTSDFSDCAYTSPLMINLLSFSARSNQDHIVLEWDFLTDERNISIELFRGQDSEHFALLSRLHPQDSEETTSHFSYPDKEVEPGIIYYYQLQIRNENGDIIKSDIQTAVLPRKDKPQLLSLFPQPASQHFNLEILLPNDGMLSVRIFDSWGAKVKEMELPLREGRQKLHINIENLSQGIYQTLIHFNGQPIGRAKVFKCR